MDDDERIIRDGICSMNVLLILYTVGSSTCGGHNLCERHDVEDYLSLSNCGIDVRIGKTMHGRSIRQARWRRSIKLF